MDLDLSGAHLRFKFEVVEDDVIFTDVIMSTDVSDATVAMTISPIKLRSRDTLYVNVSMADLYDAVTNAYIVKGLVIKRIEEGD